MTSIHTSPGGQWFKTSVENAIHEQLLILQDRGDVHGDSFSNLLTPFTDSTLRFLGTKRTMLTKRAVMLASMCDMKLNRVSSGLKFTEDTPKDLCNYIPAWMMAMREAIEEQTILDDRKDFVLE